MSTPQEHATSASARAKKLLDDINRVAEDGLNQAQLDNVKARLQTLIACINAAGSNPAAAVSTQVDTAMPGC